MERSIKNVRAVLDEAKADLSENPSFESIAEWDSKLSKVCPKPDVMYQHTKEQSTELYDMMFEWNMFSIKMQQFLNGVEG